MSKDLLKSLKEATEEMKDLPSWLKSEKYAQVMGEAQFSQDRTSGKNGKPLK